MGDARNLPPPQNGSMPLTFQPRPGSVVYCDFDGLRPPEVVKRRPVVIVNRHSSNRRLATVPLSTSQPIPVLAHHHRLESNPLPDDARDKVVWAKCDMIYTLKHRQNG